jgi:hypothetical protein
MHPPVFSIFLKGGTKIDGIVRKLNKNKISTEVKKEDLIKIGALYHKKNKLLIPVSSMS